MTPPRKILVCDDEELVRWSLGRGLTSQGYEVHEAADGESCLRQIEELNPHVVLLDVRMPRMDGLTALRQLRQSGNDVAVIIISALGDVTTAMEATRLGAETYLTKPFQLPDVYAAVEQAIRRYRLATRVVATPSARQQDGMIGASASMARVQETIRKLGQIDTPTVLIHGESGTGKDLVARAIHRAGPRASGPYVEVDCTAIPEALLESTLFGHERGAFTDAKSQHKGLFEVATGGVVFLDEIGELPPTMQAKLLRVLENRTFMRVGGTQPIRFDAAVIAATHRDLFADVHAARFREDLYYRLAVVQIELPPLRRRTEDIPALVDHFLASYNRSFGRSVRQVTGAAMEKLLSWSWPGNVRELKNVIECVVIFHEGETIDVEDLPPQVRYQREGVLPMGCPFELPEGGVVLDEVERGLVQQALERTGFNLTASGRLLGISRYALRARALKYGLVQLDENV